METECLASIWTCSLIHCLWKFELFDLILAHECIVYFRDWLSRSGLDVLISSTISVSKCKAFS